MGNIAEVPAENLSGNKTRIWIKTLVVGLLCTSSLFAQPINLTNIHALSLPSQTQIILSLSKSTQYKLFTLQTPPRIVMDLPSVKLDTSLKNILWAHTPVLDVRAGHPNPNTLRIVFDLNKPFDPVITTQSDRGGNERLVIELNEHSGTKTKATTAHQNTTTNNDKPIEKSVANSTAATVTTLPKGNRPIVVIIDPGHGGKDPGTSTYTTREKDVVLAISLNLYRILQNQPGFKPVLTRNRDYFIPLRGRLAIARQYKGDMFIAIHADAYKDGYASGAAVFALSAHGASSEAARWLAEKENYSELGGVNLRDKSDMLRSVLIDLSQTATISSSLQLGGALLYQLGYVGNLHYRTVEQAPFMVLKSPDIPSVLVETGFLSNPQEQARLRNPFAQQQIAKAIAQGIMNYFRKNPPPGTYIASLQDEHDA